MTSGNFKSVTIDSIIINREVRQRRELPDLAELAESISKVGLIHPPVVDSNMQLVSGERRLTACRDILGWTSIVVQFAESLDPAELHLIELEENVKRRDLSWQDECRASVEYHNIRSRMDKTWTATATAKALSITPGTISNHLVVAAALESGNALVVNADKYSVALGVARRSLARAQDSAGDRMKAMMSPGKAQTSVETADDALAEESYAAPEIEALPEPEVPFLNISFLDFHPTPDVPKFNFIHCDFPYGVNADKHNQGAAGAFGGYEDSADVYWELLDALAVAMETIIAPSAHMIFWFSMDYYQATLDRLSEMGWTVNIFPLIWQKTDNTGVLPDHKRGPRRIYETAFLCSRGDRFVVQAVANAFGAPAPKTIHMSEKNPDMLRHFFRMTVDENTTMLDPTMGSGWAVRVAEEMGAAYALGLEQSTEFFLRAKEAYLAANAKPAIEL
jgi:hypothetical protein